MSAADQGRRFAEAVAAKDRGAIGDLLTPDVDFKALTPGRFWEASDLDGLLEVFFGTWFAEDDRIDALLEVTAGDPVEDVRHVAYRLAITTPDGPHVAAQQAYYRTDGDRISYLRVMCSGFRAVRV